MKRLLSIAILALAVYAPNASAQRDRSARKYLKQGIEHFSKGDLAGAIADYDKSISLDDHDPLVFAERAVNHQNLGVKEEAKKDFEQGLKLNNDLRLMIDIHLLDLQLQIKEMRRRQAAIHRNIACLTRES